MSRFGQAAAIFTLGAVLANGSTASAYEVNATHESLAQQLANNPTRLKQLSALAVGRFERDIKTGDATLWEFAGVCAVIGEQYPHEPKGTEVAGIVPNPGVVHIKDAKSGATFTEAIAWDGVTKKYVLGEVAVITTKESYRIEYGYEQFNINFPGAALIPVKVEFSTEQNQVVSADSHLPVMDDIAVGQGPSITAIAGSTYTLKACQIGMSNVYQKAPSVST